MSIPTIPQHEQYYATNLKHTLPPYDELVATLLYDRLVAGAPKYGKSWAEVNLKDDLLEEIADSINYVRFMIERVTHHHKNNEQLDLKLALGDLYDHLQSLYVHVAHDLPAFDGPTSQEWVKTNA